MRKNSLAWFAIGFAIAALISSIVVGYFGLHTHDSGWTADEIGDAEITFTLPSHGSALEGNVLQKDDSGFLTWEPDSIIHSEAYGSYPAEVPFEQGMTLFPGQSATMTLGLDFSDTTYVENRVWNSASVISFEDIKIDSIK